MRPAVLLLLLVVLLTAAGSWLVPRATGPTRPGPTPWNGLPPLAGLTRWRPVPAAASVLLVLVALVLSALAGTPSGSGRHTLLVAAAALVAVVGGGPVTETVLGLASARPPAPVPPASTTPTSDVLRGGAWIGVLERSAIAAALLAGWPEGVAVALAIKGLGRYPELGAAGGGAGASEKFIIGTFASVLWAVACAGVVLLEGRA